MLRNYFLSLFIVFSCIGLNIQIVHAQKPETKVSLGIRPDLMYFKEGIKAASVTKNKPGSKAGMKVNDILIAIDGKKTGGLVQYRDLLNTYKPGDKVTLTIKRDGKKLKLQATFE